MVTLRRPPQYVRSGPVLEPYQVIVRPLITEKATHVSERDNAYTFEVNPLATKTEIKNAIETPLRRQGPGRAYPEPPGQAAPLPGQDRPDAALEEGHRHAARGIPDRFLLRVGARRSRVSRLAREFSNALRIAPERNGKETVTMGIRSLQTDQSGPPELVGQRLCRADRQEQEAREEPDRAAAEDRGPEQPGFHHRASPRRRSQTQVSDHRLGAQRSRRPDGRGDPHRIRPESLGADRT